jgi:hypothetical protein
MSIYFAIFPPPKPQNLFLDFVVPFLLVMAPLVIVVGTLGGWLSNLDQVSQTVFVSEEGLTANSQKGQAHISWAHFTGHRETWWSFILWRGFHVWVLIPKRGFNSQEELARGREIFAKNVPRSRWFFG